jgi:hypothetical protein
MKSGKTRWFGWKLNDLIALQWMNQAGYFELENGNPIKLLSCCKFLSALQKLGWS